MVLLRTLFIYLLATASCAGTAATILKTGKRSVLVGFDPIEENFVVGGRLIARKDGQKKALVEITKIKGGKLLARILDGTVEVGMDLRKFEVVTSDPAPSTTTKANVETVTIRFASTFVWRGIPYNRPFVGAQVDVNQRGLLATGAIENAGVPATSEADAYLGYAFNQINWSITPMVGLYLFPEASHFNTTDFMLTVTYGLLSVDSSYIPKMFGAKSAGIYVGAGIVVGLGQRWKALAHVGHQSFEKKQAIGYQSYADFKVATLYSTSEFVVEFAWTGTNRRDLANQSLHDGTAAATISKQF